MTLYHFCWTIPGRKQHFATRLRAELENEASLRARRSKFYAIDIRAAAWVSGLLVAPQARLMPCPLPFTTNGMPSIERLPIAFSTK